MGEWLATEPIPAVELYVPSPGELVLVEEVNDRCPHVNVGEVARVETAHASYGPNNGWPCVLLIAEGHDGGTWCRVKPAGAEIDEIVAGFEQAVSGSVTG